MTNGDVPTAVKHLGVSLERKLTRDEFEDYLKPELAEIQRRRVESAKKAVGKITTEVKEPKTPLATGKRVILEDGTSTSSCTSLALSNPSGSGKYFPELVAISE